MGAESHSERGEFRKIFERLHYRGICIRYLEGGTMPHTLEKQQTVSVSKEPGLSPLAGKPAPRTMLIDVARLEKEYFERRPDVSDRNQLVSFNPGSTLSAMDAAGCGRVAANTTLAACSGGLSALAFVYPRHKVWDCGM